VVAYVLAERCVLGAALPTDRPKAHVEEANTRDPTSRN